MKNLDKISVIHYTKLKERKAHMLKELRKWFSDIDYEFVEDFDQESLTEDLINKNFDLSIFESKFDRKMLYAEMSLCMKYKKVVNEIASQEGGEYFFVLEDDVIFKEDPVLYLESMNNFCIDNDFKYDCVFLGEAFMRKGDDRNIFGKKDHPATNGLCTVLYTKSAIEKLNGYLQSTKITQPLDWEFNTAFEKMDFQVYWGKAITKHGSVLATDGVEFEHFKSTLRDSY
tara:strand:- start:1196 stop:1882 length:687 start_codon:yes stop_codon:yes gene_type:complete